MRFNEAIVKALANLLENAVQHGPAKAPIEVRLRGEAKEVVLRIHNQGPAIPASDLTGLFSPFKRLRPGKTDAGSLSSLGLGLYIAEQIVTAHGGTIEVHSSNEAGTAFTVRLPR